MIKLPFRLVLKDRVIKGKDIEIYNTRGNTKDGFLINVDGAFQDAQSPFTDKNGKVLFHNDKLINSSLTVFVLELHNNGKWYLKTKNALYDVGQDDLDDMVWVGMVPFEKRVEG